MQQLRNTIGFTLLELVISITILAIICFIAIPAYSSYNARAALTEAINLAENCMKSIEQYYLIKRAWPADLYEGCNNGQPSRYVDSYGYSNQRVFIKVKNIPGIPKQPPATPLEIYFVPVAVGSPSEIRYWKCANRSTNAVDLRQWLPPNCQDNVP